MAGLADLFYLGQPDPRRQIAELLAGQQQAQQGPQPGAGGPAPAPGPDGPAPQGPAPAAPQGPQNASDAANATAQGGGQAPNPSPGQQTPNAPPQPTAYQSSPDMAASYAALSNPPSLMSLYMQLDARNRASDQINKGFALMASHFASPDRARAMLESVQGGPNAGQQVGDIMQLYGAQQQMGAQQQLLAQAPAIAQKLGMDEATVRAEIMAGRGPDLVSKLEPTEQQRNIQWEHDQFIKGGGSEEDWKSTYLPMIITGGIPGATPDTRSRAAALVRWKADPANAGRPTPGYLLDDTKWKLYTGDLQDAKTQFSGMNQGLEKFANDAGDIGADPELANITGSPVNKFKAEHAISGTPANDLVQKMKQLGADAKAMASRGGPKGLSQNLATLGANPDAFTDFSISNYGEDQIAPKIRTALSARANAYGAAGRINEMPGYLKQYLDPMYQPGGDLDPGGGYKPFTPSKDPDLKQPTAQDVEVFKHNLEHYGPKRALAQLKADKIDTSSLE